MSFSFVKKKHPQPSSQASNLSQSQPAVTSKPQEAPAKKGFSFIKKSNKAPQNESNPPTETQSMNNPAPSLDTLLTDDLLLLTQKPPQETSTNVNTISENVNDTISDKHSVTSKEKDNTSVSGKSGKGFGFIKKKKAEPKPQNINQSAMSPQLSQQIEQYESKAMSSNNLLNNLSEETNSINYQLQQNDELELHLSKEGKDHEQSEDNYSVSSKTKTISKSEFKIETSPKVEQQEIQVPSYLNRTYSNTSLTKESVDEQMIKQKNNAKNNYLNYISNVHCLKLKLKAKNEELKNVNAEKEKLYKEEQIAIEENDFEKADHIESSIKEFNNKIININSTIDQCIKELMTGREKELNLMRSAIKDVEAISESYGKLKNIIEEKIDSFNNNEFAKHKSENIRLQKMNEKLQFLKSNLDTEKSYIDTEEAKINEVIKGQSKGIFDDLDELNKDKDKLNEEIAELKRQLEQKENELDQLNSKIESKEIEIDAIKSNFNHEFNKIEIKKKNYRESLKDYEDQHNTYNQKLEDYNSQDIKYENYIAEMKHKNENYDNEISKISSAISSQQNDINTKQSLLQRENDLYSLISSYDIKIDNIKEKIQKHKEDIQNLNVSNKLMESEITQIEIKLPALEEEKKGFVQTKNFKEAGRVSHELKASLEKKTKNQQLIEQNKKNIELYQNELNEFENSIAELNKEKKEHEKELNIAKYDHLVDYLNTLNSYIDENRANGDLIDEIRFTKEEIESLLTFDYIKEKVSSVSQVEQTPITPLVPEVVASSNKEDETDLHLEEAKVKYIYNLK